MGSVSVATCLGASSIRAAVSENHHPKSKYPCWCWRRFVLTAMCHGQYRVLTGQSLLPRRAGYGLISWTASATVRTLLRGSKQLILFVRIALTSRQVSIFRCTKCSNRASVVAPLATAMPWALQPRKLIMATFIPVWQLGKRRSDH